jgi:hypothetical protein
MMVKQIMTLELEKTPRQLTIPTLEDLGHQDLGVVIADTLRDTPEKLECPYMSFPVGLGTFPLEGDNEIGVRIRERHPQEMHLTQIPGHLCHRLPKIDLSLSRPMGQRHEDLPSFPLELVDRLFHLGVFALVSLLFDAFIYPLRRVPLLLGYLFVALQNLRNPLQKGTYLRPWTLLPHPVARRLRVCKDLLQCLPVHPRLTKNLPPARLAVQYAHSYVGPFFHVGVHPSHPRTKSCRESS